MGRAPFSSLDSCILGFPEMSKTSSAKSFANSWGIFPERLFADTSRLRRNNILYGGDGSCPNKLFLLKSTEIKFWKSHSFAEIFPRKLQSLMLRIRNDSFMGSIASNRELNVIVSCSLPAKLSTSKEFDLKTIPSCSPDNWFPLKSATRSMGIEPMLFGNFPEKALFAKFKCHKFVMLPIVEGMLPLKWLPGKRHSIIAGK